MLHLVFLLFISFYIEFLDWRGEASFGNCCNRVFPWLLVFLPLRHFSEQILPCQQFQFLWIGISQWAKKMVETKHCQRVSIPQEHSQRYAWTETMEVPLNHLIWELCCSERERQIKPSMRKKPDLIWFVGVLWLTGYIGSLSVWVSQGSCTDKCF